jgi:hypothetical protein
MNLKKLLLPVVLTFLLVRCNTGPSANTKSPNQQMEKPIVSNEHSMENIKQVNIVLCDLTQSMVMRDKKKEIVIDSTVLQKIKDHAALIYSQGDFYTDFIYLGIQNDDFNKELFRHSKIPKGGKAAAIKIFKFQNEVQIPKLIRDTIAKTFNPNTYEKTCITHALNNVYEKFNQYNPGTDFRLIILSDMMEACADSPLGYLNLEKPENVKRTQHTLDTASKNVIKDLNALGVKIYMVYESDNRPYNIKLETMRNIWKQILLRYGYQDETNIKHADNSFPQALLRQQ